MTKQEKFERCYWFSTNKGIYARTDYSLASPEYWVMKQEFLESGILDEYEEYEDAMLFSSMTYR